jgi:fatty-acyl-CoA synthase
MEQNFLSRFRLVSECWMKTAKEQPDKDAVVHWIAGEEPFRWTYGSLIQTAIKIAAKLKEKNIKQGEICAIIIRHNKYFYPLYLGISFAGAIPSVLAYPNARLHPDKFRAGLEGISKRSGIDWIFTEKELESVIEPLVTKEGSTIKGIYYPLDWDLDGSVGNNEIEKIIKDLDSVKSEDTFLLQHSSGTTGLQKAVILSHREVIDHVSNYGKSIGLQDDDIVISWLPFYHDMGLIAAFHLSLAAGITLVQIDPFQWVMAPELLLEAVTKEKGTLAWLPNFAYNIMADKIHEDDLQGFNLDTIRMLINCSEPVRAESHDKFLNRFKKYGFNEGALAACYAMAETTYAVTQTLPGVPAKIISLDRQALSKGMVKLAEENTTIRKCVSSGVLIDGCDIKIIDDDLNVLPQEMVGEIVIKSVSLFDGYRNYPEKTAEVLKDGWYYSGDYGFKYEDEYYVIGRKKDIIIVAGENIYPEDVEDALGKVEKVIPGRVVAFGEENIELGTEEISVIAETELTDKTERKQLYRKIIEAGMQVNVTISNVYLVPSRWLIKSSAGKPSRKDNKSRILNENNQWRVE